MRIEDRLREAMRSEANEMPPMSELEARFEQRRRRYRVARVVQVAAVAAALVAIAVVVVPRFGSGADEGGFVGPAPDPSSSPSSSDLDRIERGIFEDDEIGYRISFDPDLRWNTLIDIGGIGTFAPSAAGSIGQGGSANVPAEFFVVIIPSDETFHEAAARVRARYAEDETNHDITVAQENQVDIGGRHAVSFAAVYPAQMSEEFASDEPGGCPDCRTTDYVVHWFHGRTLQIRVVARSAEANERWGGEGLQVVAGTEPLWVDGYEYKPLHGSAGTVEVDETTEEVLRFMDARIDGEGAEEWLASSAEGDYTGRDGELSLYTRPANAVVRYARYELLGRAQIDEETWTYAVRIFQADRSGDEVDSFPERLLVGRWPGVIRGAEFCYDPCP